MIVKLITYNKFSNSWGLRARFAVSATKLWTWSKYFHSELYVDGLRIITDTEKDIFLSQFLSLSIYNQEKLFCLEIYSELLKKLDRKNLKEVSKEYNPTELSLRILKGLK
jgi:hypothetical protein